MKLKILVLLIFFATSRAAIFGEDGLIQKVAKKTGISNLINVGGDARAKIGNNEIGVDGAFGIGETGIGAHGAADADVLCQKARVHADILDGHKVDQYNHRVYVDTQNRPYLLQKEFIGTEAVLVKKYLDNGQNYVSGADIDDGFQQSQVRGYQQSGQYYQGGYGQRTGIYGQRSATYDQGSGIYGQQPGLRDNQPRQYDQQPRQYDQQSGRYNQQPGGYNQQPGGYNEQPGGYNQQPGGDNQQPGGYNQQPGRYDQQPRQYEPQSRYNGQQISGQESGYGSNINRVVDTVGKNVENYRHNFESGVRDIVNKVEDVTGYNPNSGDQQHRHNNQGRYDQGDYESGSYGNKPGSYNTQSETNQKTEYDQGNYGLQSENHHQQSGPARGIYGPQTGTFGGGQQTGYDQHYNPGNSGKNSISTTTDRDHRTVVDKIDDVAGYNPQSGRHQQSSTQPGSYIHQPGSFGHQSGSYDDQTGAGHHSEGNSRPESENTNEDNTLGKAIDGTILSNNSNIPVGQSHIHHNYEYSEGNHNSLESDAQHSSGYKHVVHDHSNGVPEISVSASSKAKGNFIPNVTEDDDNIHKVNKGDIDKFDDLFSNNVEQTKTVSLAHDGKKVFEIDARNSGQGHQESDNETEQPNVTQISEH